jgi:hypothetical protein
MLRVMATLLWFMNGTMLHTIQSTTAAEKYITPKVNVLEHNI